MERRVKRAQMTELICDIVALQPRAIVLSFGIGGAVALMCHLPTWGAVAVSMTLLLATTIFLTCCRNHIIETVVAALAFIAMFSGLWMAYCRAKHHRHRPDKQGNLPELRLIAIKDSG